MDVVYSDASGVITGKIFSSTLIFMKGLIICESSPSPLVTERTKPGNLTAPPVKIIVVSSSLG